MVSAESERHIQYLNAINSIYAYLLDEANLQNLIQGICNRIVDNNLNLGAWFVVFDRKSDEVTVAEAGRNGDFPQVEANIKRGIIPACGKQILSSKSGRITYCSTCDCNCCFLETGSNIGRPVAVSVAASPNLEGFFVVRPPKNISISDDEQNQLIQLSLNIEIALNKLTKTTAWEKSLLQSVIDGVSNPVMVIDTDYNILLVNSAAARIMGHNPHEIRQHKCYSMFHNSDKPCNDERFPCPIQNIKDKQGAVRLLHNPLHGNGINNTFELEVSPLKDESGVICGIIEVARDISSRLRIEEELRKSKSHLYRLAHHDTLTGLPNRLLFRDRLERVSAKALRNQTLIAILFLDLDNFKTINERLGHDVGDELLLEIARRLRSQCRKSDTVARFGGDEFVLLLDDITNPQDIGGIALKIMDSVSKPVAIRSHEFSISTSIGIGIYPDDAEDIDDVIKCADIALYQAKNNGGNNVKYYQLDINIQKGVVPLLEIQMPQAVARKEFFLEYQPQFDSSCQEVVGFEALLRWNHPDKGIIKPMDFIPLAEESGNIIEMGKWVLNEVCEQLVAWKFAGLKVVPVSVNVSFQQLLEHDFVSYITHLVLEYDLIPDLFELELAEPLLDEELGEILSKLEQISKLGISLAIDDFGLGRSPLDYLQQLPIKRIKIDRSLIKHIPRDKTITKIIFMIILMSSNLGINVLAEGVENEEQLNFLRKHNCGLFQGFFLSKPISGSEASALLSEAS